MGAKKSSKVNIKWCFVSYVIKVRRWIGFSIFLIGWVIIIRCAVV